MVQNSLSYRSLALLCNSVPFLDSNEFYLIFCLDFGKNLSLLRRSFRFMRFSFCYLLKYFIDKSIHALAWVWPFQSIICVRIVYLAGEHTAIWIRSHDCLLPKLFMLINILKILYTLSYIDIYMKNNWYIFLKPSTTYCWKSLMSVNLSSVYVRLNIFEAATGLRDEKSRFFTCFPNFLYIKKISYKFIMFF